MGERPAPVIKDRPKPVDLSRTVDIAEDPNIINLLCGIGNSEAKALLIAAMALNPNALYGTPAYYSGFLNSFKEKKVNSKMIKSNKAAQFCTHSLLPAKLIEAVPFPKILSGQDGYRLTEFGKSLGIAFTGYMLDFSLRQEFSLEDFFGRTYQFNNSNNTIPSMPPLTRLRIFNTLIESRSPLSTTKITKKIGASKIQNIGQHLKALSESDIVNYKSTNLARDESFMLSRLSSKSIILNKLPESDKHPRFKLLSQQVYEIAYWNEFQGDADWLSRSKIADILIARYPARSPGYKNMNRRLLQKRIGSVLSHLAENGHIEEIGDKQRSEATLTELQRSRLMGLIDIIQRFQNPTPEFIEEGIRKAHRIINNPNSVMRLLKKAENKKQDRTADLTTDT